MSGLFCQWCLKKWGGWVEAGSVGWANLVDRNRALSRLSSLSSHFQLLSLFADCCCRFNPGVFSSVAEFWRRRSERSGEEQTFPHSIHTPPFWPYRLFPSTILTTDTSSIPRLATRLREVPWSCSNCSGHPLHYSPPSQSSSPTPIPHHHYLTSPKMRNSSNLKTTLSSHDVPTRAAGQVNSAAHPTNTATPIPAIKPNAATAAVAAEAAEAPLATGNTTPPPGSRPTP